MTKFTRTFDTVADLKAGIDHADALGFSITEDAMTGYPKAEFRGAWDADNGDDLNLRWDRPIISIARKYIETYVDGEITKVCPVEGYLEDGSIVVEFTDMGAN